MSQYVDIAVQRARVSASCSSNVARNERQFQALIGSGSSINVASAGTSSRTSLVAKSARGFVWFSLTLYLIPIYTPANGYRA